MIANLPQVEIVWLRKYFSRPNALDWADIERRTASQALIDQLLPWFQFLEIQDTRTPIILPFVDGKKIVGWYATQQGAGGGGELGSELQAWLGPSYLDYFQIISGDSDDPMASVMRSRFGRTVYRFSGTGRSENIKIADRLAVYAALLKRRPASPKNPIRPVGAIRSDFERALLVQDNKRAEALVSEMRNTGRLNEENLKYLDVRLKAGLGLWPQIARDHWLIKTLVDLPVPSQILADVIEALHRTHLASLETRNEPASLLHAFRHHVSRPYPRLLASRHGIKKPPVIKTFLLHEINQKQPNPQILDELVTLLPATDPSFALYKGLIGSVAMPTTIESEYTVAEDSYDDGNFDRAFALFLKLPLCKRTVQRLVSCEMFVNTDESRRALLEKFDAADPSFIQNLSEKVRDRIESIRRTVQADAVESIDSTRIDGWMDWAETVNAGRDVDHAISALDNVLAWDVNLISQDEKMVQCFVSLLASLDDEGETACRGALPEIYNAFFPDDQVADKATKPIAMFLFDLIVLGDSLSGTDLDLMTLVLGRILTAGISSLEYETLVMDLEDVQNRIGSYTHLNWSLDVCEMLAIAPTPSQDSLDARLRYFLLVIDQAQGFIHRLKPHEVIAVKFLSNDYKVDVETFGSIESVLSNDTDSDVPDLTGKVIAIYTLMESAGRRAKTILEEMFPGALVQTNSDKVATNQLTSLARAADIFVFAWKSSSHQAFYCVKEALGDQEPIMAAGKGSASIVQAVLGSMR